jgi:uncharacterized protein (TIGR02271 family)
LEVSVLTTNQLGTVIGSTAYGPDGVKIGRIGQVFIDDQAGKPAFAAVQTGLFGMNESLVPLQDASYDGERLTLAYDKDRVKDAPNVDPDNGHLSAEEERVLFEYYGTARAGADLGYAEAGPRGAVGEDLSGPETDDAMTRSEERLDVGTATGEAGRARLRKYVVTENVQQTVPVRKEKAVLEREPITGANVDQATSGPEISDEEHEVVLHEETPVVAKHTEPVERVRLSKETEVDQATVSDEVRKERIEAEGDIADSGRQL